MSSDEEDVVLVSILYALASKKKKKNKMANRSKRRTRPWLLKRSNFGVYHTLLKEFRLGNPEEYKNYLRMTEVAIFLFYLNLFVIFSSKTRFFFRESYCA